jgi:hypothetical protein
MKKPRNPAEVAKILAAIYEKDFGGKERGRFQISREGLREISGKRRLEEAFITTTINEAYELGFVVTDLGDDFSVIEESVMRNYRRVPKQMINTNI